MTNTIMRDDVLAADLTQSSGENDRRIQWRGKETGAAVRRMESKGEERRGAELAQRGKGEITRKRL